MNPNDPKRTQMCEDNKYDGTSEFDLIAHHTIMDFRFGVVVLEL